MKKRTTLHSNSLLRSFWQPTNRKKRRDEKREQHQQQQPMIGTALFFPSLFTVNLIRLGERQINGITWESLTVIPFLSRLLTWFQWCDLASLSLIILISSNILIFHWKKIRYDCLHSANNSTTTKQKRWNGSICLLVSNQTDPTQSKQI